MASEVESALQNLRGRAKAFVEQRAPSEVTFFDVLWELFLSEAGNWRTTPGERWRLPAPGVAAASLGFTEGEALDLVTPKIVATLVAALVDLFASGRPASVRAAGDAVMSYGRHFELALSLAENLRVAFAPVLASETAGLVSAAPARRWGREELLVIDSERPAQTKECTETERTAYRKHPGARTFLVDDLAGEVWVDGKSVPLTGRSRELLIYVLVHAGRYFDVSDLLNDIWGQRSRSGAPHRQAFLRLRRAVSSVLDDEALKVESETQRYYVSSTLSYRIIYRAGCYRFLDRIVGSGKSKGR